VVGVELKPSVDPAVLSGLPLAIDKGMVYLFPGETLIRDPGESVCLRPSVPGSADLEAISSTKPQ